MSKFDLTASKVYKPEILQCPICGTKLIYKHAVSNKTVQFSSGKHFKIINLGYGCPECNNSLIYFSQTANKLAFKGYTYSAKIVCMIDYYKKQGLNRDQIYDILEAKNINISDRNIDIIYKRISLILEEDFDMNIKASYQAMLEKYGFVRISLDLITINEMRYVILYDFFDGKILAIWKFNVNDDEGLLKKLSIYINDSYNISTIVSIRNINKFIPMVKSLVSNKTKFLAFSKF